LFLLKTFKALNGLLCADVPLRNYSLTHCHTVLCLYFAILQGGPGVRTIGQAGMHAAGGPGSNGDKAM